MLPRALCPHGTSRWCWCFERGTDVSIKQATHTHKRTPISSFAATRILRRLVGACLIISRHASAVRSYRENVAYVGGGFVRSIPRPPWRNDQPNKQLDANLRPDGTVNYVIPTPPSHLSPTLIAYTPAPCANPTCVSTTDIIKRKVCRSKHEKTTTRESKHAVSSTSCLSYGEGARCKRPWLFMFCARLCTLAFLTFRCSC